MEGANQPSINASSESKRAFESTTADANPSVAFIGRFTSRDNYFNNDNDFGDGNYFQKGFEQYEAMLNQAELAAGK